MKAFFSTLFFALICNFSLFAQSDSTGYAGDGFSLEGAIELFKNAKSPEEFEKLLNREDQEVNNLDLNQDGDVDYIRVIDHKKGDVHAIVLQVPVNENESQDLAVIEIEKTGKESAILQVVGNEDVYGTEVIAEPFEEKTKGESDRGPAGEDSYTTRFVVNVWFWPCVSYIYAPSYVAWVSPWRWMYYPSWWRTWRPVPWRIYHRHTLRWRPHYHRVTVHRVTKAHKVYAPRRTSSVTVSKRTMVVRKQSNVRVRKDGKSVEATRRTTTRAARKSGDQFNKGTKTTRKSVNRSARNTEKASKRSKTTVKRGANNRGVQKTNRTMKKKKHG